MERIASLIMMLCVFCISNAANYLTFTAEEDGSTFGILNKNNNPDVQYSLDGGETWTALAAGDTITLVHKGDKALLRGDNSEGFSKRSNKYSSFTMTGKIAASGSVMSLIDGTGETLVIPVIYCFYDMFKGCTSLTQAPELPATTLADYCYDEMFSGCTSLTQVPELPATTLVKGCYNGMFKGCTSLTQAPELPATTLADYCYSFMFFNCTGLTQAPELPAMTMAGLCYEKMFYGCTSLMRAPELPATTLAEACYDGMFQRCTSLTQAPALPATTLPTVSSVKGGCYIFMFEGCTSLSRIRVSFDDWNDGLHTLEWVKDVAPAGTFICPKDLPLEYGERRIPTGWTVQYIDDTVAVETNYLTFTAEEDGSTFGIASDYLTPDVQYSLNGGETWAELAVGDTILLAKKGDKALIRGYNEGGLESNEKDYVHFVMTGTIAASGSVMSLIDGVDLSTEIPKSYCFLNLFKDCTSLTQAPELPATTLDNSCYEGMFSGCTRLTQAPELPATTLADYCYNSMFSGCTGLTQAPVLPATTLAGDCYRRMFQGCTSLTQAPELPVTTLAGGCYSSMFSGCTSLTQAPELPATTLFENCYSGMFSGCTSLTRAPELPAIKMLSYCYSGMFSGCTSLTQAPELPAKEFFGKYSYSGMFSGCTSLSEIKVSFDDWNYNSATSSWVKDVAPTGTFICPKTLALEYGISWIPEGWTVKYIEYMANYLTFTAEEDGSTFGIAYNYLTPDVQYSLNGGETWTELAVGDTILLAKKGDKAHIRGYNEGGLGSDGKDDVHFVMTGAIAASGSVMSLIDGSGSSTEIPCSYCFIELFSGCTGLTKAPELPATTLAEYCYNRMFSGCTSLTQAPELPATTLAYGCYRSMFSGCTSLTKAPELPATTLAEYCYNRMFSGCTSLTQAPELPATEMTFYCYDEMFSGCTSLTQVPELPATTLAERCYSEMFSGCTSLTQAPELPVTTLANCCYNFMFSGCTNLSEIRVAFVEWKKGDNTYFWVENVAPTGTFYCPKALAEEYGESRIPEGWTVQYIDDTVAVETNYLTFTAEEDGSTFGIVNNGGNNPDVQYSLDGGETWTALVKGDAITLVNKGDKALLRGDNPEGFSKRSNKYSSFTMTGKIAASGSVMSLIDGTGETLVVPADYCFYSLFEGCTNLTQAPELPATTLADYCYSYMFKGCTSLTQAPELPATTLAERCYGVMFSGCTSLTQAPELPATTLADGCYHYMFKGCTSLTQAPELPATTLADVCYQSMFKGCISLTQAPELPATTLAERCYNGMFSSCTSLTQAPKLPATTLADYCYVEMFSGCTSLTQAPELPATTLAYGCYADMFSVCTSLTHAPELPATTLAERCYNGMFSSCTSLTQAPKLPATTLADYCYDEMFSGCTSLTQAPELPATTLAYGCYDGMFSGCTSLTKAPELPATTLAGYCYNVMFSGCTNLSEIRVAFVEWKDSSDQEDNTNCWVKNVAPTGTFYCPKALPLEYGLDRIPEGWTVKYIEEGTGVNDAVVSEIAVWTEGNTIYVRGAESDVEVYDLLGRLIASKRGGQGNIQISIPQKGIYVVKVGTETHKVEL